MKKLFLLVFIFPAICLAQKKPLDHSVYDQWQSIGEKKISNDGRWIVYTVEPQEGDGTLFVESSDRSGKREILRGYGAVITEDNGYVVFKIKPPFQEYRQARINKKKPEEMPKDSLGIMALRTGEIRKYSRVKSFKTPKKGSGWVAIQKEPDPRKVKASREKSIDSLLKTIDSLTILLKELKNEQNPVNDHPFSLQQDTAGGDVAAKGSDLILYNLTGGEELLFKDAGEFAFDKPGRHLALVSYKMSSDSVLHSGVILVTLSTKKRDTILTAINDAKKLSFAADGSQLALVAEKEKDKKALQKFYDLYLFRPGYDSARMIINRTTSGVPANWSVSENGDTEFSEDGSRLFFGTAPVPPAKDTTLIEIDLVKVDIWNYKDDYLQTQQLRRLKSEQQRSYKAVYDIKRGKMTQIADEGLPTVTLVNEGNADFVFALTDTGRRISAQWEGGTLQDVYRVDLNSGQKRLIKKNLNGRAFPSPAGRYIMWYDLDSTNYFVNDGDATTNITAGIPTPLYDELNDVPNFPSPYGIMGWLAKDASVYIYDRYDVWRVDPSGKLPPQNLTNGRSSKLVYRYEKTDPDEKYLEPNQLLIFDRRNDVDKSAAIVQTRLAEKLNFKTLSSGDYFYGKPAKAKGTDALLYTKENFVSPPDLYLYRDREIKLTAINPQQSAYNWGTAALFHWKSLDGKDASGILYKPENFDSTKKYPVILYFYERLTDNLNRYIPPAPTPSRLNISFFVSRGYLVLAPDIVYIEGYPGQSAYNYVVSGAEALAAKPWADGSNMGIQGQSWGGYQVAHLITRTNLFKAAWAGAPVSNMFSAYGGIRWESGLNRQFQYEKTQSRIGATIWDKPELYIENSPLFHLKTVNTPLVIMANDADGAVPWYQGIELFTALRRLGKPVWMLNYNGEAHNLVERKNRKDIQIREQQFFDWLLKGEKAPKWITEGVRATDKGRDWGLGDW